MAWGVLTRYPALDADATGQGGVLGFNGWFSSRSDAEIAFHRASAEHPFAEIAMISRDMLREPAEEDKNG